MSEDKVQWYAALTPRGRALIDFLDACDLGGCTDDEMEEAALRWLDRHPEGEFT